MVPKTIHRWQPTGYTPCGRMVETVATNLGRYLSEGVTCKVCNCANTLVSVFTRAGPDEWNGQSDGVPKADGSEANERG